MGTSTKSKNVNQLSNVSTNVDANVDTNNVDTNNVDTNNVDTNNLDTNNVDTSNITNDPVNNIIKLDNLLLNLRIISEIKEYDKLKVNDGNLKIDQSSFKFLTRWYNSEGRDNTIIKINNILDEIFEYIDSIKNNKNSNRDMQRILIGLTNSIRGIDCLKVTYKSDINIITNLNLYSEKIQIKINELNRKIKIIN